MDVNKVILSESEIKELSREVSESAQQIREKSGSWLGRIAIQYNALFDELPDWIEKHMQLHQQLKEAIDTINSKPLLKRHVAKALVESNETIRALANKVSDKDSLALIRSLYTVDQNALLTSSLGKEIKQSHIEWHLNLGLMMNVYNRTEDPALKKQIEFLALNYLAKAAPIELELLGLKSEEMEKFEQMFQLGAFEQIFYHREAEVFDEYIVNDIRSQFPSLDYMNGKEFLTDTIEIQEFLPLFFTTMDMSTVKKDETTEQVVQGLVPAWAGKITQSLEKHFQQYSNDPFNQLMESPILADLTALLGENIQTNGDKEKEAIVQKKMQIIENGFEEAIGKAIAEIKEKNPSLCQSLEDEEKIKVFLKFHISCICNTEINGTGVLKSIDPFIDLKHYTLPNGINNFLTVSNNSTSALSRGILTDKSHYTNIHLTELLNCSGIRLGGVSGRERILNFMNLGQLLSLMSKTKQMTEYAVSGKNVLAFENKSDIVKTALFQRFKSKMDDTELAEAMPQVAILGKATLDMVEGLMSEITDEKWQELNDNPDTRMLIQQTLYRLMLHLASAENRMDNFTKYAQAIELAQSEIATLLTLASPFKEGDFNTIYKDRLDVVPDKLKGNVKVGITKSAMNAFTGINAAVYQTNPSLVRAHGEGGYFEIINFLGENKATKDILTDTDLSAVDLYVGDFNHNINIHLTHDHYTQGTPKEDIRQILDKKKGTKHMTVALDVTIDFVNSPMVKELLEEFSKEIEDGTLNFVFFRSGQKFEMFGIDNYYGGPFWMVNNGDKQWEGFDKLTTSNTYKTDPLSIQWFCLANKYAPKELDSYRKQIFQNARTILNSVPDDLKKDGKYADKVRISTVDDKMQPSFIDIKVTHSEVSNCIKITNLMQERLTKRFADAGAKMHQRASFGFYHANWNVILADDGIARNIRINPGLNAEENKIILDFIKEDIPNILASL